MFSRLRALFRGQPQAGDLVTVLDGQHAGKTGTVTSLDGHHATVDLNEASDVALATSSLRVARRAPMTPDARPDAGTDMDHEEARARINQLPPPMV
jgi:hypothetical protein